MELPIKFLASAGCLFLAAAISPSALSHDDRPGIPGVQTTPIYLGTNDDGVSGRYVGAAGPAVAFESQDAQFEGVITSTSSIQCDFEAFVDGDNEGNEMDIDGSDSGSGILPDFWDDGGQGGACHTNSYTTTQFNTPGCLGGQEARGANDAGGDLWIAAACDWMTPHGQHYSVRPLVFCAIGWQVLGPLTEPLVITADCASKFIDCMTDPACGLSYTESCGADSIADAVNFGYGSGGLNPAVFPAAHGIWPGNGDPQVPCSPGDEVASILVFDTVATDGGTLTDPDGNGGGPLPPFYYPPNTPPNTVVVYPALGGELWTDF